LLEQDDMAKAKSKHAADREIDLNIFIEINY